MVGGHVGPRRVFLSHSSELRDYPQRRSYVAAAEAATSRAGDAVVDMETFPAGHDAPSEASRRAVRAADVYVLIAGFHYGTVVPERPDVSYTELEFETAREAGLPCLVFLVDEDAEGPGRMFRDPRNAMRQEEFRTRLESESGVVLARVLGPTDLELNLFHALNELPRAPERTEQESSSPFYDSDAEEPPFASWSYYVDGGVSSRWTFAQLSPSDLGIQAAGDEAVGINKSIGLLRGTVTFEYRIFPTGSVADQVYFAAIPMQETGPGRTGLIEVGASVEDDPRNGTSVYRLRYFPPARHYTDGEWHESSLTFDFTGLRTAFYTIFAPRINEGLTVTGGAAVFVRRVRVRSSEV